MSGKSRIDWSKATIDERAILYKFTKSIVDRKGWSWDRFFQKAVTPPYSPNEGYIDNFRAGRIDRKKATQIAIWIERQNPKLAKELEEAVFRTRVTKTQEELQSKWDDFLKTHGQFGRVQIVPLHHNQRGITRIADNQPVSDIVIKPGEHFCFEIDAPFNGNLIAFQQYRTLWYRMDLSRHGDPVNILTGKQRIPRDPDTGTIIHLSEEEDFDKHKYVFVLAGEQTIRRIDEAIVDKDILLSSSMDEVSNNLYRCEQSHWVILCINVLFAQNH